MPSLKQNSNSCLETAHSTFVPKQVPSSLVQGAGAPSRLMVAVGLVRQSDLPLAWLDPSSVLSCTGLYVPRKTRNSFKCRSLQKEKEKESKGSRLNSCDVDGEMTPLLSADNVRSCEPYSKMSTSSLSNPCVPTSVPISPRTPTSTTFSNFTLTSPTYRGLNLSPALRLDRFPVSTSGSFHSHSSGSNRAKRTANVPSDKVCSLSCDVSYGKEEVNETTVVSKKLTKSKSSHSLPSTPVVLSSKLPQLKCDDQSSEGLPSIPSPSLSIAPPPNLPQSKCVELQQSARSATVPCVEERTDPEKGLPVG